MNSLNSDPAFANANSFDFSLSVNSPAINKGVDVGFPMDISGNPIPFDTAVDIGAHEYMSYLQTPTPTPSNTPAPSVAPTITSIPTSVVTLTPMCIVIQWYNNNPN